MIILCLLQVWYAALSQSFFSLSVGFGSIIMFSSYNDFRHNVFRDATIISITDTFTSFLAGLTIFSILGYLANGNYVPIMDTNTRKEYQFSFNGCLECLCKNLYNIICISNIILNLNWVWITCLLFSWTMRMLRHFSYSRTNYSSYRIKRRSERCSERRR